MRQERQRRQQTHVRARRAVPLLRNYLDIGPSTLDIRAQRGAFACSAEMREVRERLLDVTAIRR